MRKIYITEKPNAAKDLAAAFGISKRNADGFFKDVDDRGNMIVVGSAAGHLLGIKEPAAINNKWKKWTLEELPIFIDEDAALPLDIIRGRENLFKKLLKEISKADVVINAGDAGREGELIQRWILQRSSAKKDTTFRLWASSLTKEALLKANRNLKNIREYDNLYEAAEARVIMDYVLGYNYSRAISLAKTKGVTVVYGRCQSPVLSAIIKREKEIETFISEDFYFLENTVEGGLCGVHVDEEGNKKRFKKENEAKEVFEDLKKEQSGTVLSFEREERIKRPPKPYDLLQLQKEMAKSYDYSAAYTLEICQKLYDTYKMISYPRTDGEYLTEDLKEEVSIFLKRLRFPPFSAFVEKAREKIPNRYFNDKKITDHHALIPTNNPEMEENYRKLRKEEKNVFDAIGRRFISLFMEDYRYEERSILWEVKGECFLKKGTFDLEKGFMTLYSSSEKDVVPLKEEGDVLEIEGWEIIKDCTKPKRRYDTSSLLSLMKMYQIGTGATRANIIEELLRKKGSNQNSAITKKGKHYISTDFGKAIETLIPEKLKSLELSGNYENKLQLIEKGELAKKDFLMELYSMVEKDLKQIVEEGGKEEATIQKLNYTDMQCPICAKKMIKYEKGYGCSGFPQKTCSFYIPQSYGGKKLSERTIKELLKEGETKNKISGFKRKSGEGEPFAAKLQLVNGYIKYKF